MLPNPGFSPRRIWAMLLRYLYLLRSSWPRIVEMVYWPTVQLMLWGFMTEFLRHQTDWVARAGGVLITGVLMWDVLYRGQLGVSLMFFEEMYARNLGNLLVSPLRSYELAISLVLMSLIRTLISFGGTSILAILLYQFSIYSMGFPLVTFYMNLLLMGWAVGLLVVAMVLRYGMGAEGLAWVVIFAVQPFTGIYYPITVLPPWIQTVSWFLPSTHVFEGMRIILFKGEFRTDLLVNALLLNAVYMVVAVVVFLAAFRAARVRGLLLQSGE
ncbi:MAG: ABC transporter permease [Candidatus Lambdaproteobacteria bacterium]|nr:ABC transporter permease [Candidatus Lambdaproteobacteria bacterium]